MIDSNTTIDAGMLQASSNSTQAEDDHISDEEVVKLIPQIMKLANRFDTWAHGDVRYKDLLAQADHALAAVEMFARDEFAALAPTVVDGAGQFEESGSQGFVAMGRIIQLQLLVDHPEVLHLAATRAYKELRQALHRGTLSARLLHGGVQPAGVDNPIE